MWWQLLTPRGRLRPISLQLWIHFPGTLQTLQATPDFLTGGDDAQDQFEYSVSDGKGTGPYPGSVNIRVTEVNDLPVLDTGNITPTSFNEDTATTIAIPITDSDSALAPTGCTTTIPPEVIYRLTSDVTVLG